MSSHWSRCLAQCPLSALGRPRKCQAGRGRGLSTLQPQVPRLQSPWLGKVLGSRGGGRSELRGRPVHHSPTTHRAVQNPRPVPCPRSHPRCLRSAYCPSSRTWRVRPAPPRPSPRSGQWHSPITPFPPRPPALPAPPRLLPRSGQWRPVTLTGPPTPGTPGKVGEVPRGLGEGLGHRRGGVSRDHPEGALRETQEGSSPDWVVRIKHAGQGQEP